MTSETSTMVKHGAWGAVIGAVFVMIVGFNWGGWVTASTAKEKTNEAVVASKAAICVAQFMKSPKNKEELKAFEGTESWKRGDFIEKGGWDKMPGEETARSYVSSACVEGIEALLSK